MRLRTEVESPSEEVFENQAYRSMMVRDVAVTTGGVVGGFILLAIGLLSGFLFYPILGVLTVALAVLHASGEISSSAFPPHNVSVDVSELSNTV